MFDNLLTGLFYISVLLVLAFFVSATLNVRDHVAKNRRISREDQDRLQWERFANNGKEQK